MNYKEMNNFFCELESLTDEESVKLCESMHRVVSACELLDIDDDTVINVPAFAKLHHEPEFRMTYADASFVLYAIEEDIGYREHDAMVEAKKEAKANE